VSNRPRNKGLAVAMLSSSRRRSASGSGRLPQRGDPPSGHDRRGLARSTSGPLARLHLLDPDSPEQYIHRAGAGGWGRAGGRCLIAAMDLMNFNRLVKRYHVGEGDRGSHRRGGAERKADCIVGLAEAGKRLPRLPRPRPGGRRIAARLGTGSWPAAPGPLGDAGGGVEEEPAGAPASPGGRRRAAPRPSGPAVLKLLRRGFRAVP
jgi:hypothetical protein